MALFLLKAIRDRLLTKSTLLLFGLIVISDDTCVFCQETVALQNYCKITTDYIVRTSLEDGHFNITDNILRIDHPRILTKHKIGGSNSNGN